MQRETPRGMTAADDRALRAQIIATALQMNALGINQGKSGNVSVRLPPPLPPASEAGGEGISRLSGSGEGAGDSGFLITPTGVDYAVLKPEDVALMPLSASSEHDRSGAMLPSSEWRFHRDLYAARPDVRAIVHTHSVHATTLACMHRGIPAFHYMVAIAGGSDIRCAPYATFGTQALSDRALEALAGRNACLLAQHGMIAAGPSLDRALSIAVEVEALARIYWQALQIGEPPLLSDEEMQTVLAKFRTYGQPLE